MVDAAQRAQWRTPIQRDMENLHKYTLGSEIREQAMRCLRLAKELHAFRDFGQFERAAQGAVKVGKQAGGWLKRIHNQTQTGDNP